MPVHCKPTRFSPSWQHAVNSKAPISSILQSQRYALNSKGPKQVGLLVHALLQALRSDSGSDLRLAECRPHIMLLISRQHLGHDECH